MTRHGFHHVCPQCEEAYEAEIACLRAEVERLIRERDQFQAELGCSLHEGYKLVWCGECVKIDRAQAEAVVRAAEKIWGVIPVTGPGTLGPDVAVPLLAYEELRKTLAASREWA